MAVHNLTAANVTVDKAGWQPMDTFPEDGTVVEVITKNGFTTKAQWMHGHLLTSSLQQITPTGWREI